HPSVIVYCLHRDVQIGRRSPVQRTHGTPRPRDPAPIQTLPAELLEHVLLLAAPASPAAPAALARTCRAFAALVYAAPDQHLWRALFLRAWDDPRGTWGDLCALPGPGVVGSRDAAGAGIDWGREYRRRVAAQRWFASARADGAGTGPMGARDVAREQDQDRTLCALFLRTPPQTSSSCGFTVKLVSEPFAQHANACSVNAPPHASEWALSGLSRTPSTYGFRYPPINHPASPRSLHDCRAAPDRAYMQPALCFRAAMGTPIVGIRQTAPGAHLNGEGPSSRPGHDHPPGPVSLDESVMARETQTPTHRTLWGTVYCTPTVVYMHCAITTHQYAWCKYPAWRSRRCGKAWNPLKECSDEPPSYGRALYLRGETSGSCHMVAVMFHIGLFFMSGENHLQPLSRPWQLYKTRYRRLKGALRDEDLRWPTDIARTNLSKIGGCDILDNLLTKWQTGKMRFELLDPARRPVRLELRQHTRSDAGHSHVFADKREPMKRKRRGHKVPKSALIIENSDVGSDADATAGGNIESRTESADEDESRICKQRRLDLSNDGDQYGNSSAPETIEDFSSDARSLAETIEDADDWDILILPIATLRGIQNCVAHPVFDLHFEQQTRLIGIPASAQVQQNAASLQRSLHQLVLALDALKDEVACLLLAKPHSTVRRYIELAIEHCAEVRIFLLFDILLHREDVPFDNIDACMQQHPALMYSVLKHYLPAGLVCLPDVMAPLATFIMHNGIPSATHFRIAALAALERLTEDLAHIDLAAFFGLLWSVVLADAGKAKADADAGADVPIPMPAPLYAAQLTHIMAHGRMDAPTLIQLHL
ncbi:hypothetical protein POSPLADRAFT_1140706, partial [Postia placenta MAD-698-R-SB12]